MGRSNDTVLKRGCRSLHDGVLGTAIRVQLNLWNGMERLKRGGVTALREREGQGTTEYAIIVGVLVVIAVVAVAAIRGKVQELWTSISTAVNGL